MRTDKAIVLTGGGGFIGSAVLKALNDQGIEQIIVVDDLALGDQWKNLVGKRFLEYLHKDQLFEWLKGKEREIQAFIHLGACSSTVETNVHFLLENNTRFSIKLAQYALQWGHRFIYASSAATYGDGSQGFDDAHERLDTLRPLNIYGFSKHLFDLWLLRNGLLDRVTGLKYFNVYGPNEGHKGRMSSAVPKMWHEVKKSGKVVLFKSSEPEKFADGEQVRDFIYVKDAAMMTLQFLTNEAYGIYNVGMGRGSTWRALAEALFFAMGREPRIEFIQMPEDLLGRYQNFTEARMEKSKERGLMQARFSLEQGVVDYVREHLEPQKEW